MNCWGFDGDTERERERERAEREKRRQGKEQSTKMDVDGDDVAEEDMPSCDCSNLLFFETYLCILADISIEAPPSLLPQRRYCDITGLEVGSSFCFNPDLIDCHRQAPYTDPATGLRYHDKSVYDLIKGLVGFQSHHFTFSHQPLRALVLWAGANVGAMYSCGTSESCAPSRGASRGKSEHAVVVYVLSEQDLSNQ